MLSSLAACTLCTGGEPVSRPDKLMDVPILGLQTCAEIEESVVMYGLTQGSELCSVVKSLGSECGCPVPEGACRLCHDGSHVAFPDQLLGRLFLNDFFPALPASNELMSCGMLEGVLLSMNGETSICIDSQQEFSELCGCPSAPPPRAPVIEKEDNEKDENRNEATALESPGQCTVCQNGEEVGLPNRTLDFEGLPVDSCSGLDSFAANLSPYSTGCTGAHGLGTYCGCPVPENAYCSLCPNGEPVRYPDQKLDWFSDGSYVASQLPEYLAYGKGLTCGLLESILHSFSADQLVSEVDVSGPCALMQLRSSICGCDPYWKEYLLVWSYRLSGFLSLLGSLLILYDVLSNAKKRSNTYSQLMVGVSSFDMVSSLAYVLTGFVLPASSGFRSASGNEGTCKMQGFLIQFGQTSVFYNLVLSIYYLLVVKYNWREFQFERLRRYVHGTLVLVGFGMAFGAFPFYEKTVEVCTVLFPPLAKSYVPHTFFVAIPLALTCLVSGVTTAVVCLTVYLQEKKAVKWSLTRKNLDMTKKVVQQSVLYVAILYITLIFQFGSAYVPYAKDHHYWILFFAKALCAPSQGFFNWMVFTYRAKRNKLFSCSCCCGLLCFKKCRAGSSVDEIAGKQDGCALERKNNPIPAASMNTASTPPMYHSESNSVSTGSRKQNVETNPASRVVQNIPEMNEPEVSADSDTGDRVEEGERYLRGQKIGDNRTNMSCSDLSGISFPDDNPDADDKFSAAAELWLVSQEKVNYPRMEIARSSIARRLSVAVRSSLASSGLQQEHNDTS